MQKNKKINVALVMPPVAGHTGRGIGIYTEKILETLGKNPEVNISQVRFGSRIINFDIIHYPYFDPFFLTLPIVKRIPTVVTVHDLIPLKFPQYFPKGLRGELKWRLQKHSLKHTAKVITDSYASKKDIQNLIGIPERKIKVVYLGVNQEFHVLQEKVLRDISKKLQLPKKYILYVGDVNYNKNIPGILKIFSGLRRKFPGLRLILAGRGFSEDSREAREVTAIVKLFKIDSYVLRPGRIETDDLVGIYNLAQIYLEPSFAEGFGLPILEAMACGCPVVTSNISSLPELVGGAGIKVNPYFLDDIIKVISALLNDTAAQNRLKRLGLKQVQNFSWEKCGSGIISVYRSILS
jgi:glycosyltransferase involved in cell wall biosynthesis